MNPESLSTSSASFVQLLSNACRLSARRNLSKLLSSLSSGVTEPWFFYRFGHDSLLLAGVSDSNSAFGVSLVSWTGGAEWARELGNYSCDMHREFTSFPHPCAAVPKLQATFLVEVRIV